ncbi:hypothetical protein [Bordetella genomosp. 5]|uniref:hypothetical protein n=1 Tax=Bordetella genomosp. 5 TaxID=1395608 RepID=UPI0020CE8C4D|nr:hypothetical protein [Bordetella genomosp. 5]
MSAAHAFPSAEARLEAAIAGMRAVLDRRGSRRLLLLCDTTLDDPLGDYFEAEGLTRRQVELISQGASRAPLSLVEVPDEERHERVVNASVRLAIAEAMRAAPASRRPRSMAAWLATDLPLAEAARRMVLRGRLRDAQGRVRMFRYWDPRSTQFQRELYAGATPASWIAGTVWMYVDAFAHWHALPDSVGPMQEALPDWARLNRLGCINAVLQRLNTEGLRCVPEVLEPVRQALDRGAALALADDEDLSLFAAWRVVLDAPIERAPSLLALIEEVREEGGRLRHAARDMDDEDWQAFAQEARMPEGLRA